MGEGEEGIHHVLPAVLLGSADSSLCKIAPVELNTALCAPVSVWTKITELAGGIYVFVKLKVLYIP